MARPNKDRLLEQPPKMAGFKPFGIPLCKLESVCLKFEEYESLRLVNYEKMSQDEAAAKMNISRPTLTRIYNRAVNTIAVAFVEGKAINIAGGNYQLIADWFRCRKCHKLIEGIDNHVKCENCNQFGKEELMKI